MYKLSKRSYERLNGVNAILIGVLTEAIKESPHDFGIPRYGGKRTTEVQNELFQQGKRGIKGEEIITFLDGYNKRSYHQTGKAFDIFGYKNGKASWDKDILKEIATHILKVAKNKFNTTLEWGGNWDMEDMPHFQIS